MRPIIPLFLMTACGGGLICPDGTVEQDGACVEAEGLDTDGSVDDDDEDDDGDDDEDDDDDPDDDPDDPDDPDDDPDVGDLIEDAQPCEGLVPGDRLALEAGCVDDVCVQGNMRGVFQTFGRPDACQPATFEGGIDCRYPSGVTATAFDTDRNGRPDPTDYLYSLRIEAPYGGTDPDGLGLGISPGCFVEVLGTPSAVTLQTVPGEEDPWASYAYWEDARVVMQDNQGGPQPFQPDGRVDILVLYGPAPQE